MQIGLTKKLLDYAGIKGTPADLSVDPLFSWSANLLTIRRKKTIVCMNDASRFAFFIHGIKAADVKRLDQLMLNGIRACMDLEAIAPEIVKRYLLEGSRNPVAPEVSFTKTASRRVVSVLNQVCMLVENMAARDPDHFPPQSHGHALNRIGFIIDKTEMDTPYGVFMGRLSERYGDPVVRSDAVELSVVLDLDDREAVRRIIVPTFYTFAELHQVIQSVYLWKDYHLHEFILEEYQDGRPKGTLVFMDEEGGETENRRIDADVRLSEVFVGQMPPEGVVIVYVYDFGDVWEHFITCERIVKGYNRNYAQCTYMEGDAPPEDAGGPGGFQYLLEILNDETHPEYAQIKEWVDETHWKPLAEGDMAIVNQHLQGRQYELFWY